MEANDNQSTKTHIRRTKSFLCGHSHINNDGQKRTHTNNSWPIVIMGYLSYANCVDTHNCNVCYYMLYTCSLISFTARSSFFNFMRRFWNLFLEKRKIRHFNDFNINIMQYYGALNLFNLFFLIDLWFPSNKTRSCSAKKSHLIELNEPLESEIFFSTHVD